MMTDLGLGTLFGPDDEAVKLNFQFIRAAFQAVAPSVNLDEDPKWLVAPNGEHGNLGRKASAGDVVQIPHAVGSASIAEFYAVRNRETDFGAGVLLAVMEEDDSPDRYVKEAYDDLFVGGFVKRVGEQLWKSIRPADPPVPAWLQELFDSLGLELPTSQELTTQEEDQQIEAEVFQLLRAGNDHWWLNDDDVIGVGFRRFTLRDYPVGQTHPLQWRWNTSTGSTGGSWQLDGSITLRIP